MEIASVFLKSADLLLKITTSPIAKEIKSICKYESQIKRFADTVAVIGDVLSNLEDKQFQGGSVQRAYTRLREVYLDAEDFLDVVETYRKKRQAVTTKFNEEKGEMMNKASGKRKQLLAHARIKKKAILMKTCRFLSGPNPVKMQKAMKEIMKNLDEIEKDMKMFEQIKCITSAVTDHVKYRATGPCVDADKVIGREEDKSKIVGLLTTSAADPKKIPVISIVGMGGLGKTTTAQLLYDDESWQQSCRFDLKFWVPDSKQFDVKSLLKNILKSISRNDNSVDTLDENHLRERIVEKIGRKSFFLVLDDVENEDIFIWEKLESLLNHGNRAKSRILVTTRSIEVAKVMGSDSRYELRGLSKTDALHLFERYAFQGGRDEDLVEIAKLVVEKCHGVPLAIQVIGSLLHSKGKQEWERVMGDIGSTIKDDSNHIIPILMISYYNLDSTLKQCFSYFALFPQNYNISKHILSSIWRANIRLKNGSDLPEDDCENNLKTLCDRCLIEEVHKDTYFKDTYFKMHDFLHELANRVAGKKNRLVISNATTDSNKLILEENVRHVSLRCAIKDDEFPSFEVQGKRLSTFLQVGINRYRVGKLVLDCPVLRLLDVGSWGIKNLTSSIGKLIHLRYLDLSYNSFKILPNSVVELMNLRHLSLADCWKLKKLPMRIEKLTNLEVLDISYCSGLKELPMGIVKLINLKYLNLEGCSGSTRWPTGMGALKSIRRMEKFIVGDPKSNGSAQLEELIRLSESIGRKLEIELPNNITLKESFDGEAFLLNIKSLEELKIKWRGNPKDEVASNHIDILAKFQPTPNLKKFHLSGYEDIMFPPWIPNEGFASVLPNLTHLYISNCGKCQHLPLLSRLPCLKHLELCGLRNLEYIEENVSAASFCSSLNKVILEGLPNLKGWCRGAANGADDDGEHEQLLMLPSFPCLSFLHFGSCPGLTVGRLLLSLFKVCLVDKNAEEEILSSSASLFVGSQTPALFSFSVNLLVQICRNGGEFYFCFRPLVCENSLFRKFDISVSHSIFMNVANRERSDGGITYLDIKKCLGLKTLPGLQHLTALVHLGIRKCCDFTGERDAQMSWKALQSLRSLRFSELPKMKRLPEGIQFLPFLHRLVCEDCCEFTGEIDGQVSWKHLQSLESLTLIKLPKMKRLPEGIQFLTSLEKLQCEDCCEVTGEIDGQMSWKHFQSLKHLTLTKLPKMKRLPEGIQSLTSLRELTIQDCENLLLPEWLKKTFNTRTNKRGYYTFHWVMDRHQSRDANGVGGFVNLTLNLHAFDSSEGEDSTPCIKFALAKPNILVPRLLDRACQIS